MVASISPTEDQLIRAEAIARANQHHFNGGRKAELAAAGCWFCGGPNTGHEESNEDYWPRWLWKHPKFRETEQRKLMVSFQPSAMYIPDENVVLFNADERRIRRPRHHDKARGFCRTCNNGWMSEIQGHASNSLGHAFYAEPGQLDREKMAKLVEWILMTSIVIDTHQDRALLIPASIRHGFANGMVPDHSWIMVARFVGTTDNALCFKHGATGFNNGVWSEYGGVVGLSVGDFCSIAFIGLRPPIAITTHLEALGFQWLLPATFSTLDLDRTAAVQDGIVTHAKNCVDAWLASLQKGYGGPNLEQAIADLGRVRMHVS